MTKTELTEKMEEKIKKGTNKARIIITRPGHEMIIDTITIVKDHEDGHINGNVHAEEDGKIVPVAVTLAMVLSLADNPAVSVDLAW